MKKKHVKLYLKVRRELKKRQKKRRSLQSEDKAKMVPKLRTESRRVYLAKREPEKIKRNGNVITR